MLADEIESPGEMTAEELLGRYEEELADAIEAVGRGRAREVSDLPEGAFDAAASGDAADLPLAEVAAILALEDGRPDAETMLDEVRNRLMLEMSGGAINVDLIAADVEADLDAKEIQAKMEGRLPMTLAEYAVIRHYVANAADW